MHVPRTAQSPSLLAAASALAIAAFCSLGWAVQPAASDSAPAPDDHLAKPETTEESAPTPALPWLRTMGRRIVDEDGSLVKLRGVNVEGWLMWQGSIWGAGLTRSESNIVDRLTELSSPESVQTFRAGVFENFITEADVARIKELGANVIRLPFHYRILEDDENPFVYKDSGWALLDRFIGWCEKYGIYVILDTHSLPGGQSAAFVADPPGAGFASRRAQLWENNANLERAVALWTAIASRYAEHSVVAGYDRRAAPDTPKGREQEIVELYRRIISAVRSVDSKHMLILHGAKATTDFEVFPGRLDSNQVYEPHQYTWFMGTPDRQVKGADEQLAEWRAISAAHQVPLWIGEFGENRYRTLERTVALYEEPANEISGWGFWVWKRAPTRYPPLVEIQLPKSWEKVAKWVDFPRWPNKRPTESETIRGMADFVEAMKLENCTEDPKTIDLLPFRVSPQSP